MSEQALRNDLEAIKADLAQLRGDLKDLTRDLGSVAREQVASAKDRMTDAAGKAYEKGKDAAHSADQVVREHPWAAVGVAFAVGLMLGAVLRR